MKTKRRKVKRVVLGTGHPWFKFSNKHMFHGVTLYKADPSRFGGSWDGVVQLNIRHLGAYNKIRLVAEVLR